MPNQTEFYILKGIEGIMKGIAQKNIMKMRQRQLAEQAKSEREQSFIDILSNPQFISMLSPEGKQRAAQFLSEQGLPVDFARQYGVIEQPEQQMLEPTARMKKYGYTKPMTIEQYTKALNDILDFEKATGRTTDDTKKSDEQRLYEKELEFVNDTLTRMLTSGYEIDKGQIKELKIRKRLLTDAIVKLARGEKLTDEERRKLGFSREEPEPGSALYRKQKIMEKVWDNIINQKSPVQTTEQLDPLGIRGR